MTMLDFTTVLRPAPTVLSRRTVGEVLVATRDEEELRSLRGTAADLWDGLEDGRPLGEVVIGLAEAYEVGIDLVWSDVSETVVDLVSMGLLVEGGA